MLARSAFRPRRKNRGRPASKKAPAFLQWLRGRPCVLERAGDCDGHMVAAHVDYAGDKGVGTKVSDRFAVPMCDAHHTRQHIWGWESFEKRYDLKALEHSHEYWRAWPGRAKWEAAQ